MAVTPQEAPALRSFQNWHLCQRTSILPSASGRSSSLARRSSVHCRRRHQRTALENVEGFNESALSASRVSSTGFTESNNVLALT